MYVNTMPIRRQPRRNVAYLWCGFCCPSQYLRTPLRTTLQRPRSRTLLPAELRRRYPPVRRPRAGKHRPPRHAKRAFATRPKPWLSASSTTVTPFTMLLTYRHWMWCASSRAGVTAQSAQASIPLRIKRLTSRTSAPSQVRLRRISISTARTCWSMARMVPQVIHFHALSGFFSSNLPRLREHKNVFSGQPVTDCKVAVEFTEGGAPAVEWSDAKHPGIVDLFARATNAY